ncbi:MAG: 30S ribosomal protein S3 [Firmicutes bacterium]|jgi:small subunit ribosomal protein S3|nr:30S ribosomal protein S3 [Bacillota bacterium]
MGQKVNPHGLRLGINKEWDSVWYAEKDTAKFILEDHKLREYIKKNLKNAKIARITIKRTTDRVKITLHSASPGIIIGRNGAAIKELTEKLQKLSDQKVDVEIFEIKRPEVNAQLVAETIAVDLENRTAFRRAMRQAMQRAMKAGSRGIKTMVSGRLGGADIARSESFHEGTIPLQTLRADIDYGFAEAKTTYGILGVKVWLYKGDPVAYAPRRGDRDDRGPRNRREGGAGYANAKKGKTSQAVPRQNDRQGAPRQ